MEKEVPTINYASAQTRKADSLRKAKANRWKKRILGGLAGLALSVPFLTNGNLWYKLEDRAPGALAIRNNFIPANWYFYSNGIHSSLNTGDDLYSAEINFSKKSKSIDINVQRNGNLPAEISFYTADYESLYSKKIKLP